jgi:hypothetical protein
LNNSEIHCPRGLEDFFEEMTALNGPILVLRGYDQLPFGYRNDVDIFVESNRIYDFLDSIEALKTVRAHFDISVCRLGLIKGMLHLNDDEIPLDIMFQIGYCGIAYQDVHSLCLNSRAHQSKKFKVPALSDEIRISVLKELLHNRRARKDKLKYLTSALSNPACDPTSVLFNSENLQKYQENLAQNKLDMFDLGSLLRRKLFLQGFIKKPLSSTLSIIIFVYVKYILKSAMLSSGIIKLYLRTAL